MKDFGMYDMYDIRRYIHMRLARRRFSVMFDAQSFHAMRSKNKDRKRTVFVGNHILMNGLLAEVQRISFCLCKGPNPS